jgi:hypothetical protein
MSEITVVGLSTLYVKPYICDSTVGNVRPNSYVKLRCHASTCRSR